MREHELIHMDKETGLMTLSNKGMQQCTKCGQRFGRGGNFLRYHIAKCDGTLVEKRRAYKYPCVDCGKKFASKVTCAVHMTEAHKRHIDNIEKFCFECKKEVDEEPFAHAKRHNCAFKCHQVRNFIKFYVKILTFKNLSTSVEPASSPRRSSRST